MSAEHTKSLPVPIGSKVGEPDPWRVSSPVYQVLETMRSYDECAATAQELSREFERTYLSLRDLVQQWTVQQDPDLRQGAALLTAMAASVCRGAEALQQGSPLERREEIRRELEEQDGLLSELRGRAAARCEESQRRAVIAFLREGLAPADVATGRLTEIQRLTRDLVAGALPVADFLLEAERMRDFVTATFQAYRDSSITEEEWTLESSLGDELLQAGSEGWREGLTLLQDGARAGDRTALEAGLRRCWEANIELVLVGRLLEYVRREASA